MGEGGVFLFAYLCVVVVRVCFGGVGLVFAWYFAVGQKMVRNRDYGVAWMNRATVHGVLNFVHFW